MEPLCQVGPAASAPINPSHLPWLVYAYDPNGFVGESAVGCNTNVVGTPSLRVHE